MGYKNFKRSGLLQKKFEVLLLLFLISGCTLTVGTTSTDSGRNGKSTYHFVRKGENLFRISKYYYNLEATKDIHRGIEAIKKANNMHDEQLSVGKRLLIPDTSKEQPSYSLLPPALPAPGQETQYPPTETPDMQGTDDPVPIITDKVFIWPVEGKIICGYGELGNEGLDIVVDQGLDVHASDSGMIVFSGKTQKHQETVIIEHQNNIYTIYAHDIEILAKQGSSVKKGDVIARIKSGTHRIRYIHFEIRIGKTAVNPLLYLPPAGEK